MEILYRDVPIHYNDVGKGRAVVLLHGFLENSKMWEPFIPQISKNNRVVTLDLPGHGKSGCVGKIHTMELMAEAVDGVLSTLNIEEAQLVGHSMGGYVALAYAERFPEKLRSLCLMNSTSDADDKERKALRSRSIKMAKTNYETLVRLSFINLFSEESRERCAAEIESALLEAEKTPLQGYIACTEGMKSRPDRGEVFKNLDGKKMMMCGMKDSILNPERIAEIAKSSKAELVTFPNGHMSHIEDYKEFTYKLLHFIEK